VSPDAWLALLFEPSGEFRARAEGVANCANGSLLKNNYSVKNDNTIILPEISQKSRIKKAPI